MDDDKYLGRYFAHAKIPIGQHVTPRFSIDVHVLRIGGIAGRALLVLRAGIAPRAPTGA